MSGVLPRMGAEIPLITKEIPLVSAQIPLLSAHIPITLPRHWGFLPSRHWGTTGLPTDRRLMVDRPTDVGGIVGKLLTAPIQPLLGVREVHRVETRPGSGLEYAKQEALLKELEEYEKREPKLFRRPRKRLRRHKLIGAKPEEVPLKELEELKQTDPKLFRRSRKNKDRGAAYRG
ncbi:hypothetical protein MYX84_07880 [Acidobacteria bacterium AH-259-O06]|nr:hypothetical protein [Acidobacteria bacterium AH-259-O06]